MQGTHCVERRVWVSLSTAGVRVGPLAGRGFYVEDDGPGVPVEDREAVFGVMYSSDPDGTGFGLAISKQVADAHGWAIGVVEGTDGGARFEVSGVDVTRTGSGNAGTASQ